MTSPSSVESSISRPSISSQPISPQPISAVIRPGGWAGILSWIWLLFWSGLLITAMGLGVGGVILLMDIPPFPNCERLGRFSSDSDRLLCAETQAASNAPDRLIAALDLVRSWPPEHALYEEAEPLMQTWARDLLAIARSHVHRGQLSEATDMVAHIPPQAEVYEQAQHSLQVWQQEWERGGQIERQVQAAFNNRNWQDALDLSWGVKTFHTDYWVNQRFNHWQQQIAREQAAWKQLQDAQSLGASDQLNDWLEALQLAQTIDLRTRAWTTAQTDINRWSQKVMAYALQLVELGNLNQAIAIVQAVPPDLNLASEGQDLLRYGQAQKRVADLSVWEPKRTDVFNLMEAIAAVEPIQPDSALYAQAQSDLTQWRSRLQDLLRLQAATWVAALGQPAAYEFASQQAARIAANRPARGQAQTLLAHWRQQQERIEDRPHLRQAHQLAQPYTLEALQQAIAEASQIEPGRALRIEAQSWIAEWQANIQIIEDQPILNQANQLARDGQLAEAIQIAQQISGDRALYEKAQAGISDWTAQIQIAEDSPILAEAKDLAYQGSLTRAINLASQIGAGRALYPEAQQAIALWTAERAYIWSIREEASAPAEDTAAPESTSEN
ncbi:MAG: hypothetical protein AAGF66_01155 [Cyanobacteria bacterium P01_H01_bin.119]